MSFSVAPARWVMREHGPTCSQPVCYWNNQRVIGTISMLLEQSVCYWNNQHIIGTISMCILQHSLSETEHLELSDVKTKNMALMFMFISC